MYWDNLPGTIYRQRACFSVGAGFLLLRNDLDGQAPPFVGRWVRCLGRGSRTSQARTAAPVPQTKLSNALYIYHTYYCIYYHPVILDFPVLVEIY